MTVTDGTVTVGNNSALGSGTLTLGFASDDTALLAGSAVTVSNTIDVSGGSGGTSTLGATIHSGTAQFSGNVNLDQDLLLNAAAGGTVRLSGTISGSGGLTTTGPGVLVLSGSNNFTGLTTVSAGKLILTSPHAIVDRADVIVGNASKFSTLAASGAAGPETGQESPSPAGTPVPEPGAIALLATILGIAFGEICGFAPSRLCVRFVLMRRPAIWTSGATGGAHRLEEAI